MSKAPKSGEKKPHDITTKGGLTTLYNMEVVQADKVKRPLGLLGNVGVKHSGVIVTTKDGEQWLVHKGKGYGDSSDTVVTNTKHMSDKWVVTERKSIDNAILADFVKVGGKHYNLVMDNCHDASERMMDME